MAPRNKKGLREWAAGFEQSGMTRREYCREAGIAVTTLDYYRRRGKVGGGGFVELRVEGEKALNAGFTLVLTNGRRIEADWGFAAAPLARLIELAERA